MNISASGKATIYRKDFDERAVYRTGLSKKVNGEWVNGYIDVQFKKSVVLEDKTKIIVPEENNDGKPCAWLTFYLDKNGKTVPYIFINEFEAAGIPDGFYEDEEYKPLSKKPPAAPSGFAALEDDEFSDIPF